METEHRIGNPDTQGPEFKEQSKPHRKYYYHGTISKDFEDINTEGLHFREGLATLSVSPSFTIKHWSNPDKIMDQRKRSGRGKVHDLTKEETQGVILILEPKEYQVTHISTFPAETEDEVFFRNHWERHHQALYKPENRRLLRERLKKKEKTSPERDVIPPAEIKMALLPTPELKAILDGFLQDLKQGNLQEESYIKRLTEYLESGIGTLKDEVLDKKELAAEMIKGEIEQFIITSTRKLFLSIKHYQGKDVYTEKKGGKVLTKVFEKQDIEPILNNLKSLKISDPLLQRYLQQSTHSLEQELRNL